MSQPKPFDKRTAQLTLACQEAKTLDDLTRAIMDLPDPYVYREGQDTGIFSSEEFKAVCSLEGKGTAYWDLHLTLLEAVKSRKVEVWNEEGKPLSILEIVSACQRTEQQRYQVAALPLPIDGRERYSNEILLPFRRPAIPTL